MTSTSNRNLYRLFPRDLYGRIALALASLFFGPISAVSLYALVFLNRPPQKLLDSLFWIICQELFLALSLFFACGLIWALATPRWLERSLHAVTQKLALALLLFMIPFGLLAFWAMFRA